ncbi:unnamed protein product [Closterium sp. Naga37s-1]|nr:unnamed protein product [Closterium sp. Naga37s-1]
MPCLATHEPLVSSTSHCLLLKAAKIAAFLSTTPLPALCLLSLPARTMHFVENGKVVAANFPFCTIEPNVGVVAVPDPRLGVLSDLTSSKRTLPATVEFVDIAGLVKGASQGEVGRGDEGGGEGTGRARWGVGGMRGLCRMVGGGREGSRGGASFHRGGGGGGVGAHKGGAAGGGGGAQRGAERGGGGSGGAAVPAHGQAHHLRRQRR